MVSLYLLSFADSNFKNCVTQTKYIVGASVLGLWAFVCDLCLKAALTLCEQLVIYSFIHLENIGYFLNVDWWIGNGELKRVKSCSAGSHNPADCNDTIYV